MIQEYGSYRQTYLEREQGEEKDEMEVQGRELLERHSIRMKTGQTIHSGTEEREDYGRLR